MDGETGVLADEPEQLVARVRELVANPSLRERMGAAAEQRARAFTWEPHRARGARRARPGAHAARCAPPFARSAAAAAGVAAATLTANALSLVLTMVLARALGVEGYGALAALDLGVPDPRRARGRGAAGSRRVRRRPGGWGPATERAAALARRGGRAAGADRGRRCRRGGAARAAGRPRGRRRAVGGGDRAARRASCGWRCRCAAARSRGSGRTVRSRAACCSRAARGLPPRQRLVIAGGEVAGALLGTVIGMLAALAVLGVATGRAARGAPSAPARARLRDLAAGSAAGVAALTMLAVVQHVDVIVAKHQMSERRRRCLRRRGRGGQARGLGGDRHRAVPAARGDPPRRRRPGYPRPVFLRTLAILGLVAAPALLIFLLVPSLLLRVAFGGEYTTAADALVVLGAAMALLATAYLAVQYMLALRRTAFPVDPRRRRGRRAVPARPPADLDPRRVRRRRPGAAVRRRRRRARDGAARVAQGRRRRMKPARMRELWRLWRAENEDPEPFYRLARRSRRRPGAPPRRAGRQDDRGPGLRARLLHRRHCVPPEPR